MSRDGHREASRARRCCSRHRSCSRTGGLLQPTRGDAYVGPLVVALCPGHARENEATIPTPMSGTWQVSTSNWAVRGLKRRRLDRFSPEMKRNRIR
jgi:hypothetical protein